MRNQLSNCPNCGTRLIPTPTEFKTVRQLAGLTQREMGKLMRVQASHIAYLESNKRSPSGALIVRFRAVQKKLIAEASKKVKQMESKLPRREAIGNAG